MATAVDAVTISVLLVINWPANTVVPVIELNCRLAGYSLTVVDIVGVYMAIRVGYNTHRELNNI